MTPVPSPGVTDWYQSTVCGGASRRLARARKPNSCSARVVSGQHLGRACQCGIPRANYTRVPQSDPLQTPKHAGLERGN